MKPADDRAVFHALLDASVDAILVSDSAGQIIRANKATAALFGYAPDELTGKNVRILMPGPLAAQHDGFMHHHLETGEKRIIGIGREVEGLRADGTVFPLHLSVGRADYEGETSFVAILHDETRRKAADEAMARSQRMDAIGQMTGGIAHDFNNLLTVIIGNLELVQMSGTSEANSAMVADALEAAQLGADLTSRLMVFSRKSSLKSEVVALNDVVERSLAMLKRAIGAHIEIKSSLAEGLWPTRVDATQLQTAILNLALNAQEAMPNGGRLVLETQNITLDDTYIAQEIGVAPGSYVRLSVSDNGEGMSKETSDRALEPFFTTRAVGKGTGLGLSMVYGFVKQSDGHLTLYSEEGKGTTISLYFPVVLNEVPEGAQDLLEMPRANDIGGGRLVLVVEDDEKVRRLSELRLRALGFRCITATTADDAWDILNKHEDIAVVFTDLVMPGKMSGHDLAQHISAKKPGIAVLMTSGFSESVLPGGRLGDEFTILRKPYRHSDLAAALRAVLDG